MDILLILTDIVFFVWIIRNIFYWTTVWQQYDYRFDVLFFRLPVSAVLFVKWLFFFAYFFVVFFGNNYVIYQLSVTVFYLFLSIGVGKEIASRNFKRPRITLRSGLIIYFTFAAVILLLSFPLADRFFWFIVVDLIIPVIVAIFAFVLLIPTEIYADWQIEKARKKIKNYPRLLVIFIAGSEGISLTKELMVKILSKRFRVVSTKGKSNELGIARAIVTKVHEDTEIFITDVRTLKKGDITSLSRIITPTIGVITLISDNGAASVKNTRQAKKYTELIDCLPKNGLCLFNGDSKYMLKLYEKAKKRKSLYCCFDGSQTPPRNTNDIAAYNIVRKTNRTAFDIQYKRTKPMHFSLRYFADIAYLLPAMYLALSLGMSRNQLKQIL